MKRHPTYHKIVRGALGLGLSAAFAALSWGDITNTASVTFKDINNTSYGPVTSNPVTVTVTTPPSITLTKTASPMSATSGATVTFTIAYSNTGASAASNVTITDVVPAGSTFVSGSITGGGSFSSGTNTVTWNIASVAASGTGSVSFQVKVN